MRSLYQRSFIANAQNTFADARNKAEVCWNIQVEVSRLSFLCCADIVREEGIVFNENSESGSEMGTGRSELFTRSSHFGGNHYMADRTRRGMTDPIRSLPKFILPQFAELYS